MTVLQSQHRQQKSRGEAAFAGLWRAYVEAVAAGDPRAHARGLDLADAAWELVVAEDAVAAAG
jgi:hypothetical protein